MNKILILFFFVAAGCVLQAAPPDITASTNSVSVNNAGAIVFPTGRQLVQVFTSSTRNTTAPVAAGQFGWQSDDHTFWYATGTSAGNWTAATQAGSGTVTSVALTLPSFLSVSGSPVTTSGTLAVTLATQSANRILAGPATGVDATPTFRALVAADIPSLTLSKISDAGTLAGLNAVGSTEITNGAIVNADINAAAAIDYSKLNLAGSILNADLAGGIAYSKLALTGSILNADLVNSAITINGNAISLGGSVANLQTTNGALALAGFSGITGTLPAANLSSSVRSAGVTAQISTSDATAIPTGKIKGFATAKYSGTITAFIFTLDTGTATVKVWKIAAGTAKPTAANSINTNGVAISTGTHVRSTTLADFTTTTVTAGDVFAVNVEGVTGTPTELSFELEITRD